MNKLTEIIGKYMWTFGLVAMALMMHFAVSYVVLFILHKGWPEVGYFSPTFRHVLCLFLARVALEFKLEITKNESILT